MGIETPRAVCLRSRLLSPARAKAHAGSSSGLSCCSDQSPLKPVPLLSIKRAITDQRLVRAFNIVGARKTSFSGKCQLVALASANMGVCAPDKVGTGAKERIITGAT